MKQIAWTEQAKADIRGLDRATAMRMLHALHRFAESGTGDIKALQGGVEELRLRAGDYRLFFVFTGDVIRDRISPGRGALSARPHQGCPRAPEMTRSCAAYCATSSTRRFFARPSSVAFVATGA